MFLVLFFWGQVSLCPQTLSSSGLHSKLQASRGYMVGSCLKNNKKFITAGTVAGAEGRAPVPNHKQEAELELGITVWPLALETSKLALPPKLPPGRSTNWGGTRYSDATLL